MTGSHSLNRSSATTTWGHLEWRCVCARAREGACVLQACATSDLASHAAAGPGATASPSSGSKAPPARARLRQLVAQVGVARELQRLRHRRQRVDVVRDEPHAAGAVAAQPGRRPRRRREAAEAHARGGRVHCAQPRLAAKPHVRLCPRDGRRRAARAAAAHAPAARGVADVGAEAGRVQRLRGRDAEHARARRLQRGDERRGRARGLRGLRRRARGLRRRARRRRCGRHAAAGGRALDCDVLGHRQPQPRERRAATRGDRARRCRRRRRLPKVAGPDLERGRRLWGVGLRRRRRGRGGLARGGLARVARTARGPAPLAARGWRVRRHRGRRRRRRRAAAPAAPQRARRNSSAAPPAASGSAARQPWPPLPRLLPLPKLPLSLPQSESRALARRLLGAGRAARAEAAAPPLPPAPAAGSRARGSGCASPCAGAASAGSCAAARRGTGGGELHAILGGRRGGGRARAAHVCAP